MTTDPGAIQFSGSNITGASQQGSCGFAWSPTGTVTRVVGGAPGPLGLDSVKYGSTASRLFNGHDRVGPATQPYYRAAVVKIPTWVNLQRTLSNALANNNNQSMCQAGQSLGMNGVNSSGGNPSYGGTAGAWMMIEQQLSGSSTLTDVGQDYVQVRGLLCAGVNFGGVTGRTGQGMGSGLNVEQCFYIEVNGRPSLAQLAVFNGEIERRFGSDVVRVPLVSSTRLIVMESQSNGESQGVVSDVGPGFTLTTPLSAMTRTSPSVDRSTCPLLLRVPRTRPSCAPIGKWGYEQQFMLDLKAGGKEPAVIIKNAFSSSSMVEALAAPIYPLVVSHFAEFTGELTGITKCFLVVDRGNTDDTQGISQATARTRYNNLYADRIALIKAQCPSLTNGNIYIISVEIGVDPAFVAETLAVNLGRLDSLTDQAGLGYGTANITTADLTPAAGGAHWDDTQNNTVGSRIATGIAANW